MSDPIRCPKCKHRTVMNDRRFCVVCEPIPTFGEIVAEIRRLRDEAERISEGRSIESWNAHDTVDTLNEFLRFLGVETCMLCVDSQERGQLSCPNHTRAA